MTLYGLLAALVWAAVAAFFVRRIDRWVHLYLSLVHSPQEGAEPVEIPDDLEALALNEQGPTPESTASVQDEIREGMLERFSKLKDWNKVRRAYGVGSMN